MTTLKCFQTIFIGVSWGVSVIRGRDESVEKVSLAFLKPLPNANQSIWLPSLFSLTGNLCGC